MDISGGSGPLTSPLSALTEDGRIRRFRNHANVYRSAAAGGVDRGNIDSNDPEIVELHRCHLSDRHGNIESVENVASILTNCGKKGGSANVKLGDNFPCDRVDCRGFGT